ncbi:hypothetical protein [Motilimonas sp. 1_MG-2023]|uniref:hypothetical protein n=1 Tax=Motilimonas TaxID=1914248 RepID=UPI0026E33828|nr:hypothetical protein [Motilimonas sp. 1_MG-2023]MDO6526047.1 hypothetical protein [Motilimonas sp. 1_MG-2023]
MKKLIGLLILIVVAVLAYRQFLTAEPLQTYYFKTIPVSIATRPDVNVESKVTEEMTFELASSGAKDKVVLTGLVLDTVVEDMTQQSIEELDQEDFYELISKMDKRLANDSVSLIERGFVEQAGQRGYRVVFNLNNKGKEMIMEQRMFVYQAHMLLLMTMHQGGLGDEKTAEAFFDSLAFL